MDIGSFIGRLHPLMVHLPIGFLLLALIFQVLTVSRRFESLKHVLSPVYFLGVLASAASVTMGLLLSENQSYPPYTLQLHKWMGIGVMVLSTILFILSMPVVKISRAWTLATGLVLFGMLIITGHLGGMITHGKGYLSEYAPEFARDMLELGVPAVPAEPGMPEHPDSIWVWDHLVKPVMVRKCNMCHEEGAAEAELILGTREGILKGSVNGPVAVAGYPEESELYRRVSTDPTSKKFMPPHGVALSYKEVRLIENWIREGLSFEVNVSSLSDEMKEFLEASFGVPVRPRSYIDIVPVTEAPREEVERLRESGFSIDRISANNNYLDVRYRGVIDEAKLTALLRIREQVSWLDLGETGFQDHWFHMLGSFPNLTKLGLQKNRVSGQELHELSSLKQLESLNLYQTEVDGRSIRSLADLPRLNSLYIWNTRVTPTETEELRLEFPGWNIR